MFEYSYNPSKAMLNKKFKFSYNNMAEISNIVNNILDDSEEFYDFLNKYDDPFWNIAASRHNINIEIHADLFVSDEELVKQYFKDAIDKAVRIMLESNFNDQTRRD